MTTTIISILTYILEACVELLLIRSLLHRKWKDMFSFYLLLLPVCGILDYCFYALFSNVFGWFIAFPICIICYKFLLNISFSDCIFSYLLSYIMYSLIEAISILVVPRKLLFSESPKGQLIGTSTILLIIFLVSLLPLHKLYNMINKGNLIIRLIISYAALLLLVTVALTKTDSIDAIAILPMTVTCLTVS